MNTKPQGVSERFREKFLVEELPPFEGMWGWKLPPNQYAPAPNDILDFLLQEIKTAKEEQKEIVICAAVRASDGKVIRGHRHANAMHALQAIPGYEKERPHGDNQGFVTSKNRYVNRTEGAELQKAAGIQSVDPTGNFYCGGELYSEDLY